MLNDTTLFSGTSKYYMSTTLDFYMKLKTEQKIYHNNTQPGEEWLQILYKEFFNIHNNGNLMFFMWRDCIGYHKPVEVDNSEFVLLELEIPNNIKVIETLYDEWRSLGMDIFDNACSLEFTNEYLMNEFGVDLHTRFEKLSIRESNEDVYQYMIPYVDNSWVKTFKYVEKIYR